MKKAAQTNLDLRPTTWADIENTLSLELRRACGVMATGDGWRAFLTERLGKWALQESSLSESQKEDGYDRAITSAEFYELAIEYGYGRLKQIFSGAG